MATNAVGQPSNTPHELSRYFGTGIGSDLTVIWPGVMWQLHRTVVCGQVRKFEEMIQIRYQGMPPVLDLSSNDDSDAVFAMLEFLYKADYSLPIFKVNDDDDDNREDPPDFGEEEFHPRVYALATTYGIPSLRHLARLRFYDSINDFYRDCWDIPFEAHTAEIVYGTTSDGDRGLRDIIVDLAVRHAKELFEKESGIFKDSVKDPVLTKFWKDVARAQCIPTGLEHTKYQCPKCKAAVALSAQTERFHQLPQNYGFHLRCPCCKEPNPLLTWEILGKVFEVRVGMLADKTIWSLLHKTHI
ncbi:hypothetical protein EJ08DRAFT_201291 [Tothia fuscella]|uniref:BTB domain-containing protein n=1 Tax=Tothia fuscella TaxID=1048955 RepID=A0A9P4NT54_9PEZI|nr:hypothetical protein EJ08DRAFT_201291 [Tothia fuscella]